MSASDVKSNPILHGDIRKTLQSMTVPMLLGMITLMSFNLVDTFFISLLGTEQLAAISFTFPVTFALISLSIGLSIGTSAVIAKGLGAGKTDEVKADSLSALWLTVYLTSALAFIGYLTIDPLFRALGASETVLVYVRQYMVIWFAGSVLLVIPMVGNAILRAAGETKFPAMIMACSGLLNAVLDPLLIFGWGPVPAMGMQGAALASIISWLFGTMAILHLLVKKFRLVNALWQSWAAFVVGSRKILRISLPATGANMLTPLSAGILTAIMAAYGEAAVAAFGVGTRLESIASLVVLALSMTLPPFISQNLGAAQYGRVLLAYRMAVSFILRWQFLVYLLLAVLAWPISFAFAEDAEVAEFIRYFIWIMPLAYGLQGTIILTNSSFNALHQPMKALLLSVIRLFVFYVPFAWLGGILYGVTGLFMGCVLANLCTAFIAYRWFNLVLHRQQAVTGEVK